MKEKQSLSETALNDYIKANRKNEKRGKGGPKGKPSLRATRKAPERPERSRKPFEPKPKAVQQKPQNKLEIKNCHVDLSNKEIYDIFAKFGTLTKCKLLTDDIGRSKGIAIVEFENAEHAKKAIEDYNDKEVKGNKLEVKYSVRQQKADNDKNKKITKEKNKSQMPPRTNRKRADSNDSYDRDDRKPHGRNNRRDRSNSDGDERRFRRNDRNDRNDRNKDDSRNSRNNRGRKNSNENNRRRPNRRY